MRTGTKVETFTYVLHDGSEDSLKACVKECVTDLQDRQAGYEYLHHKGKIRIQDVKLVATITWEYED